MLNFLKLLAGSYTEKPQGQKVPQAKQGTEAPQPVTGSELKSPAERSEENRTDPQ